MSAEAAYVTSDPATLAAYVECTAEFVAHREKIFEQLRTWGLPDEEYWFTDSAFGGTWFRGAMLPEGVTRRDRSTWPEGWRVERDSDCLVPARSTKGGKVIAPTFDALQRFPDKRAFLPDHGMPKDHWRSSMVRTPGLLAVGDPGAPSALWVTWGSDIEVDRRDGAKPPVIDAAIWRRAKLSEFYAAREAVEAERDS